LSEKEKIRRTQRPVSALDENRYDSVKRSMAGIKYVIKERKRIECEVISPPEPGHNKTPGRRTRVFPDS
jgi:hypothetical protein